MAELAGHGLEVLPQLQGLPGNSTLSPVPCTKVKAWRTHVNLLTAALLGILTQTALHLEPDMATETRGQENESLSFPDSDQLHLDFSEALST